MNTLLSGRATAIRTAASALFAVVGLCTAAHAQTTIDVNSLSPSQKVITCNAGSDQILEAGIGTVVFHGTITNNYQSDPPPIFMWVNENTGQTDETGSDATETAPRQDTTFRLVVLDVSTMNWGDATFKVTVTDTTAPQIWLNGTPTMLVAGGTPWIDPGVGMFDNEDGTSVPVTVTGSVNTNAVGVYTITYTATDSHNNSSSVSRAVDVFYSWSGFNQPVNMDGSSIFKLGSTIPLKFQLTGGNANVVGGIVSRLYLAKMNDGIAGSELEATSTSTADTGNVFRFGNGTYMYNLSTKGLSSGTWQLTVDMGDGALHTAIISLKS